ncbi:hypothetical protein E2C01_069715 [Portunus trituberculatus]|uniref:Uncharacterized protein n=1 Tax=Portunus trituberculatus TaxID=210409 RepID=A0A5B7I0B5_PORTR|nr:hypothetical protein [Portunus trituberculatus]
MRNPRNLPRHRTLANTFSRKGSYVVTIKSSKQQHSTSNNNNINNKPPRAEPSPPPQNTNTNNYSYFNPNNK